MTSDTIYGFILFWAEDVYANEGDGAYSHRFSDILSRSHSRNKISYSHVKKHNCDNNQIISKLSGKQSDMPSKAIGGELYVSK